MISAKEAKAVSDEAGLLEKVLLPKAEELVLNEAKLGNYSCHLYIDASDRTFPSVEPIYEKLIDALCSLGFTARVEFYGDSYVPKGLMDDYGNGPGYKSYGVYIGWLGV